MDLKEWIPGFGSEKKDEKGVNSRESYRYDIYMLFPFLFAFLCLCCLRTRVRSLGTVCVGSQSFGVEFVLHLFSWIPDSLIKILKIFESVSQSAELVGKKNQPVH